MTAEEVKWLHVEASSRCNAWCPLCPRNINGNTLHPGTTDKDLSIEILKTTVANFPNLYAIQFCGNHGDPIAAKNFLNMINAVKPFVKKIQIHTNGSLRNTAWWKLLAERLKNIDHDVWFGIDGLENIHEIYRQGTDWHKIIANATAFINNGGYATWQFIPFQHNEHQLKECIKLSQKLKFKKFKIVKSMRENYALIKNNKINEVKVYRAPLTLGNIVVYKPAEDKKVVDKKNCMHLTQPSIYLDADGKYSYCCYYTSNSLDRKIKFDSLEELFYNNADLSNRVCIKNCGT